MSEQTPQTARIAIVTGANRGIGFEVCRQLAQRGVRVILTMDTNAYGPLLLTQAFVPLMKVNGYGRIVNVSSGIGQLSDLGSSWPAYRLSKILLNIQTRIIAGELRGSNILINAMCPGWVRTDMGGPGAPRSVEEGADNPRGESSKGMTIPVEKAQRG